MSGVVPFPEKVMVQTISRCNAACAFCPYPIVSETLPQGTMDEPLFRKIIDECAEHPEALQNLLLYLMNEPLLDPEIVDRINYAKASNPAAGLHILTNGSLLTERRGDALLDSALDWIGISVHGHSEEAYGEAMGLKREVTYRRVERFIDKAIQRRGEDFVMVTFNGGGPVTGSERDAELTHFRALGVKRLSYFGRSISRAGNVPGIDAPRNDRILGCGSIWWPEMLHVLYSGDVILCCMDWQRSVVLGNLREQTIEALWRSDAYRRVRDMVHGRALLDELPCSRCEEAILEPVATIDNVDVGLVVLPCAVMDSDASTVPGVQYALRAKGLAELLADLSLAVYRRMSDELTYLWRRAGHGVIYHGDASTELATSCPDEVEWCVTRARELPADHLVIPILTANEAFALEVIRRIKERHPERSILVYGEQPAPPVLDEFGVPYHVYTGRDETAAWIVGRVGREDMSRPLEPVGAARAEASPEAPAVEAVEAALEAASPAGPKPVRPPWRPPEWEGTGAGMVPPAPEEQQPSPLSRWFDSLRGLAESAAALGRNPLAGGRQLARQGRATMDGFVGVLVSLRGGGEVDGAALSGVPGTLELPALQKTVIKKTRAKPPEPLEPPAAPPPPTPRRPQVFITPGEDVAERAEPLPTAPGDHPSPWQHRPDQEQPTDVLLGTLPPWGFENPPVGLAHLASYARAKGYTVEMLDLNIDLYYRLGPQWQLLWHVENKNFWSNESTFELLLDVLGPHLDLYAEMIAQHPAPLVGLSVVDPKERCTIELIRRVKAIAPEKRFLLGGPACVTGEYRRVFTDTIPELVDGFALGEGEGLLCEVIEAVRSGADWADLPGVLVHRDGQDLPVKKRKRLPLDEVPFPDYADFDFGRYPGHELIVEWSRGCIGSCTFCKGKMIDGRYRVHSAAAIFEGMKGYVERLGLRDFTICDPVINGDVEVMAELCRLICEAGLELRWRGEAIPHSGLTAELLQQMRAAGCTELQLGLESGSDTVLERMNKRRLFSASDAAEVIRDCHAAGIRTALFIIIGFPGEGEQEFLETYNFVKDNAAQIDELKSINALHIITDTPVHLHPDRYKLCLPERDYHYRWSTEDGENTLEVRNERIRRLMALADEQGIYVRETNLAEGKQRDLEQAIEQPEVGRSELVEQLRLQINALQSV
jgi:radical SAM superfamily enzyme YgiQ (UPF0313 family)